MAQLTAVLKDADGNVQGDALTLPTGSGAAAATTTGLTAGLVYRWNAGTSAYVVADPDDAICETCELLLAVSTTKLIATGLATVTVASAVVGSALYLDDAGAITATVPSSPDDDGRVGRMVAWCRSATTILFDGHIPGATFEVTAS